MGAEVPVRASEAAASAIRRQPEFDAAVVALVDSLESGHNFDDGDLAILLQGLGRFLRARFQTLDRDDAVDAINDALVRFIAAVCDARVDAEANPPGYLTRIVENSARDRLRQRRGEEPVSDIEAEKCEDAPADALVEVLASHAIVLRLMAIVRDRGEHELNVLIEEYLNLAEPGATPTLRQLGRALSVSHTEVRRRLERLGSLAAGEGIDAGD